MKDMILEMFGISILTSSIFIVMIIMLRAAFHRKISMRLQYAVWLLVAIKLLLIPVPRVASPVSVMNLTDRILEQSGKQQIADNGEVLFEEPKTVLPEENMKQNVGGIKADKQENIKLGSNANRIEMFLDIAGCGSVFMLLYFGGYNFRFALFLRKRRMRFEGYDAKLPVYLIEGLPSPCLYGKAIYITPEVTVDEKKLCHVITHEYCHYRQGDLIWSGVRSLCLIIYWWNPLVWIAACLAKQDCELACDEAAMERLGEEERILYGQTLIGLITIKTKPQDYLSVATTMTGGGRSMKQRISRIATKQKSVIFICILLGVLAGIGFVSMSTTKEKVEELTIEMVIEMFNHNDIGTADYFSFSNAKIGDKEEAQENGWYNYYVDYTLSYQGETYRLGASHNVETDKLEEIYLTRESDMDSRVIYSVHSESDVVENLEEFLNTKVKLSDMLTIELPEGYTLSEYKMNIGVHGGVLIEPEAYQMIEEQSGDDYETWMPEWTYSGVISVMKYPKDWFVFEDGKPIDKHMVFWNHTIEEKVEVLDGLAMPAILYQATHDLYTAAEMEALSDAGIELAREKRTSSYWYIYFASPDKEEAYYLSLDKEQFTKEAAIEIAKTVKFVE